MKLASLAVGLFAVAGGVLLFQKPLVRILSSFVGISYLAESEFTKYADDGSTVVYRSFATSYMGKCGEVELSETVPDHPFRTATLRIIDTARCVLKYRCDQNSGVPLDYAATCGAFQPIARQSHGGPGMDRITMWAPPDHRCVPTRITIEERHPDGRYVLRSERRLVKVDPKR